MSGSTAAKSKRYSILTKRL